jgi:hypothetical protein
VSKRNKLRYQSKGNQFPLIVMTGKIMLRHEEEEAIATAEKGDLQLYISTDSLLHNTNVGNYNAMGFEGYLKAEIFDGKGWKPLSLEELFSNREYYFSKRERPIDTISLCRELLKDLQGTKLMRTYREHYVKTNGAEPPEEKLEKKK